MTAHTEWGALPPHFWWGETLSSPAIPATEASRREVGIWNPGKLETDDRSHPIPDFLSSKLVLCASATPQFSVGGRDSSRALHGPRPEIRAATHEKKILKKVVDT